MPKSNYPAKIDTSVEIPAVRDNLVEIGSDVLNSLRSAIFQIEKTLGVNPQGATGNTVASRLNAVTDGNGNILKEALDKSGILSGPITNEDVAKNAGIDESKLKLRFPTDLLQDEVSQLLSSITVLTTELNEINSILTAHINSAAINRHKALSISLDTIGDTSSPEGMTTLPGEDLQSAIEDIFAKHINYDGTGISLTNRSHKADQVYFDNTGFSIEIPSNDTQGAIEDVLGLVSGQSEVHQYFFHENGLLRKQKNLDSSNANSEGLLLIADEPITFSAYNPNLTQYTSTVSFTASPIISSISIEPGDIIEISSNDIVNRYQIANVITTVQEELTSVEIFGSFVLASSVGATASIYKNPNRISNLSGLMVGTREFKYIYGTALTKADIVQVANPNATTIISNGINATAITSISNSINVSVDGSTAIQFALYDVTEPIQSLDSIIKKFNEQVAAYALPILAYRVDFENRPSEMAIVHNLANSSSENHTITISAGASGTAIFDLGFGLIDGIEIFTGVGTQFFVQGKQFDDLNIKLETNDFLLLAGTSSITTSQLDFTEYGIKVGDLVTIFGSSSDDGSYVVLSVASNSITVESKQLQTGIWSGTVGAASILRVVDSTISFENLQFSTTLSGLSKTSLVEVFLDSNLGLNYNKVFEYGQATYAAENLVSIINYEGDPSVYTATDPGYLKFELLDGEPYVSLDGGPKFQITNYIKNNIDIYSNRYKLKLTLLINSKANIVSYLNTLVSPKETLVEIFGFKQISYKENIIIARVNFESLKSRVTGAGTGLPKISPAMRYGTLGMDDVGTDVIREIQQRPLEETRGCGVISGLDISISSPQFAGGNYIVDISAGVCYVKGKRFEFDERISLNTGVSNASDNIFIAINEYGEIVCRPPTTTIPICQSPFNPYNYCLLGRLEYNNIVVTPIDLRLFIDHLDLKVLNSITVSPQPGIGHFTDVSKALRYAARFSQVFPQAGIPKVHLKSGTYKINLDFDSTFDVSNLTKYERSNLDGIWINFPVILEGEGDSTVIDISKSYTDYPISSDDRLTAAGGTVPNNAFGIQIAGSGLVTVPTTNVETLTSGIIKIKDINFRLSHIEILNPLLEDGSGNKLNYEIIIENCTFDYSENPNPGTGRRAIIISSVDSTASEQFGNIKVIGCNFINSNIRIQDFSASNARNMLFANNSCRLPGAETSFVTTNTAGHIFDPVGSLPDANIDFYGNQLSNNTSIDTAYIDSTNALPWGDRVSRMLTVAGALGVGNSTELARNTAGRHRLVLGDSNDSFANRMLLANDGSQDLEILTNSGGTQTMSIGYDQSVNRVAINYGDIAQGHLQIDSSGNIRVDGPTAGETNNLYFGNGTIGIKKNSSNQMEVSGRLRVTNGLVTIADELVEDSFVDPNTSTGLVYVSDNKVTHTYSNEIAARIGNGGTPTLALNMPAVMAAKIISISLLVSEDGNTWYPPNNGDPLFDYTYYYNDPNNIITIEFSGTNLGNDVTIGVRLFVNYYSI
jgi:hypothetical protein